MNNEGTISVQELRSAIKDKNMKYGDVEVDNLFKGLDYDHSGQIHYKEFLAAAMESQNMITAERLLETFDRMDEDNSGCISRENLRSMLGKDWDESAEEVRKPNNTPERAFLERGFSNTGVFGSRRCSRGRTGLTSTLS